MCDPCCWLLFALLVLFSTAASRSEGVGPQPEGPNAELSGATERGSETLILNPGPQSHQPCRTALCREHFAHCCRHRVQSVQQDGTWVPF